MIDGGAEVRSDGNAHTVKTSEMISMRANHPHALHAHKRFKMVLTMIRG